MTKRKFPAGLIALQAPAHLAPEGEMPARLVMMKWGENQTAEGPMTVGLKTLQASTLWDGIGFGEVAIDFNHNTVPGHESYKGEPAKIAGMARPRVIEGEGLVFEDIRWTPEGVENRGHYPDISPAIQLDESGEVIFCHSAALARNGAVKDLHLCAAKSFPADLTAHLSTLNAQLTTDKKPMIDLAALKKLLKLPDDATDEDVNKAILAIAEKAGEIKAAEPADADIKALNTALLTAINAVKTGLEGELKTLTARLDSQERDAIVAEATATGRVVPADWLPDEKGQGGLPLGQLRTLCATLPEIVPMERRTPRNVITLNADPGRITPEEREVMKHLNLTEEQWKKAN